ncbi:MAG: nucleotidyltransferase, partial [Clostridia bacterium]|nr:nucleotidyltransferase [Clostridia bacterium]
MNNPVLVVMAAGLGSRYGGLKQMDPMGPCGQFIIDYSLYDAVKAGFKKVIFIIKEENREAFEETIGSRVRGSIEVEYVYQRANDIPEGFSIPEGRVKPWGTGHAV